MLGQGKNEDKVIVYDIIKTAKEKLLKFMREFSKIVNVRTTTIVKV